jgi:hypothetical protein
MKYKKWKKIFIPRKMSSEGLMFHTSQIILPEVDKQTFKVRKSQICKFLHGLIRLLQLRKFLRCANTHIANLQSCMIEFANFHCPTTVLLLHIADVQNSDL